MAYASDLDSESRHKRFSPKNFKQNLGFLGANSIKRQGNEGDGGMNNYLFQKNKRFI